MTPKDYVEVAAMQLLARYTNPSELQLRAATLSGHDRNITTDSLRAAAEDVYQRLRAVVDDKPPEKQLELNL